MEHIPGPPGGPDAHARILVIDDDDVYRDIIVATLRENGYTVLEAADGEQGVAAAKREKPGLILCDITMPKMNGHAVLEALNQSPEASGTPFIFLTGNSRADDIRQGMREGADDYLVKPFVVEDLLDAVKTRLEKRSTIHRYYEKQFDELKESIVKYLPHEFRTPMNGILGFSEILQKESGLAEAEVKEIGSFIYRSGMRLNHLLENMILLGELSLWLNDETQMETLRRNNSALLLESLRSAAQTRMTVQNRSGAVEISATETLLRISSRYLVKIFEEVIDNALKFSQPGTAVKVESTVSNTDVAVAITDRGRGMTQDQVQRIAAFRQYDRRQYEQQGAGLGLVIVKAMTEVFGGTLTIRSELGVGTTVTIRLPRAVQAETAPRR